MKPESEHASTSRNSLWLLALLGIPVAISFLRSSFRVPFQDSIRTTRSKDNPQEKSKERQNPSSDSSCRVIVESLPTTQGPTKYEKTQNDKKGRREWVAIFVQVLILVGIIAYACITQRMWKEMQIQNKNSTQQMELSQRPWVSMDNLSVIAPLVFDSNGAHTTISYAFTDTGHSPAIDGVDLFDFMVPFGEIPSPVKKRDDLCKSAGMASERIRTQGIGQFSKTWFPGQPQPMTFQISWNINDIKKAMVDIPKAMFPESTNPLPDYFMPTMVVCIAYRPSFTEAQYHTGYILELVHKRTFKAPLFMKRGEVPADDLQFVYHPFYGVDAN